MKFGALLITDPDGVQRQYDIDVPSLLVGSGAGSGIFLDHPSIAERHAKLLVESGSLMVEDLGSEGGTSIHGRRLGAHTKNRIEAGDPLRFGELEAVYLEPRPVDVEPLIPRPVNVDEAPDGTVRPLSRILLTLTLPATTSSVEADIPAMLRVENRGRVVDEIELIVSGIPPGWVRGLPRSVRLVTGGSVDLPFVIHPPALPEALAGKHDVVITATSGVDSRDSVEIGRIEILPFEFLELEIGPHRAEERFEVTLRNEGNIELDLEIEANSQDERMRLEIEATRIQLKPGDERRLKLRARVHGRPLFGRKEVIVFTVGAAAHNAEFDRVERFGQLLMKPPLQPWKLPMQLLFALAVVGAVFAVFWFDWPLRADVDDFNVPAIPIINEEKATPPPTSAARPPATALAGATKESAAAQLAKLEERYAGVHLCGTATGGASATKTPAALGSPAPLFRQNDPAWANEVYASADKPGVKSSCGKTLATCGCEVTSMATVLGLLQLLALPDGQPLNPATLNRWFQQDAVQDATGWSSKGYAYGDVVWSAANALSGDVSRSRPGTPRLRYLGAGSGTEDEIKAALEVRLPVILEVPGHYIAATGLDGDKILIHDPYYPERKTLDAYKGKVLGSVLFQPAEDLSGLTITAGADMRVRVTDSSGRVVGTFEGATGSEAEAKAKRDIPAASYTFKDAWRDPNCIESAPPPGTGVLQIHLPAPEAGAYKVEVTNAKGGGTALTMHIYDRDGNVRIQREEGTGNRTVTVQMGG